MTERIARSHCKAAGIKNPATIDRIARDAVAEYDLALTRKASEKSARFLAMRGLEHDIEHHLSKEAIGRELDRLIHNSVRRAAKTAGGVR